MKLPLLLLSLVILAGCQAAPEPEEKPTNSTKTISDSVTYEVSQSITLFNEGPSVPEKHNLWVALVSDQTPYQEVITHEIQPSTYTITTDEYGNQYAEFDLKEMEPGTSLEIVVDYMVRVREIIYDLADCSGDLPDEFIQSELHVESNNPQIISLAKELTSEDRNECERIRTFYDYIGDNLEYTYNGNDWGAQAALGKMGADCTEYSSLLIALSRAIGIPARYVEGLLYLDESNSSAARQEHAWVEAYFPGNGWVPIDPTLGRFTLTRNQYFARYSPNHIIVTNGRNPSTLRGASYWSHLYWPGDSTTIRIQEAGWKITPQTVSDNR